MLCQNGTTDIQMDEKKKFVTLEGLKYFLEKFKYEMAHNGPSNEPNKTSSEDSEEENSNE